MTSNSFPDAMGLDGSYDATVHLHATFVNVETVKNYRSQCAGISGTGSDAGINMG